MCGVLRGGELVPDAGLLQGQTQTGQSPLKVHAQGQVILEEVTHYHLGREKKNICGTGINNCGNNKLCIQNLVF